nr:Chain B, CONSENSUS ANKYRIN REPEAT DOMAIN-LEU [synthetic construct]
EVVKLLLEHGADVLAQD